jgi:hypothetical protein
MKEKRIFWKKRYFRYLGLGFTTMAAWLQATYDSRAFFKKENE